MSSHALIVGGGLAGSALAIRLARAGRKVHLFEREALPVDKVCGEFLSREAGLYLASLGVDLPMLGAVSIHSVRIACSARVSTVQLPFTAQSLSRRVLDEALINCAVAAGAEVTRGLKVQELAQRSDGDSAWEVRLEGGTKAQADTAFLATGKHDLRGHKRPPGTQDDLVAFKMYYRLGAKQAQQLDGHVELVLFDGGYAGLQAVEGGRANLCLLVRKRRFAALGQSWDALLASMLAESPLLRQRFHDAAPLLAKPLAMSAIPYGHLAAHSDGSWRLGDQAAVIPSFSGDGMSIALHSAELAAEFYLSGKTAEAYQRRLAEDVQRQLQLATILSQALVRKPLQHMLTIAARMWPGLVSAAAFYTRVSDVALSRTTALQNVA
jgi:menaquinone-9 beta-reductase